MIFGALQFTNDLLIVLFRLLQILKSWSTITGQLNVQREAYEQIHLTSQKNK
jgi:hypothetical protein